MPTSASAPRKVRGEPDPPTNASANRSFQVRRVWHCEDPAVTKAAVAKERSRQKREAVCRSVRVDRPAAAGPSTSAREVKANSIRAVENRLVEARSDLDAALAEPDRAGRKLAETRLQRSEDDRKKLKENAYRKVRKRLFPPPLFDLKSRLFQLNLHRDVEQYTDLETVDVHLADILPPVPKSKVKPKPDRKKPWER